MTEDQKRMTLRERVAARKAGKDPEQPSSPGANRSLRWLSYLGIGLQVGSFLLLLAELLRLILANFSGIAMGRLVILLALFFTGRAIQILLSFRRRP